MMENKFSRSSIELVNMEFYAYHGCFREEQIIGNKFVVSMSVEADVSKATISDDLADTLNYQELYNIIKAEMEKTSKLLEHVAGRIIEKCHLKFPSIFAIRVEISKINPPIGGKVEASRLILSKNFN